jgi:hypothetical protein
VSTPLERYLDLYDEAAGAVFVQLDRAIRGAGPELESAIKYRLLSYTLEGDWRHWVCAVNATRSAVCLRFLWGVLLDDPLGVLRPGTSTLMTWDLPRGADVDADAVGRYVRDALDRRDHFLAHDEQISAAARARYGKATR